MTDSKQSWDSPPTGIPLYLSKNRQKSWKINHCKSKVPRLKVNPDWNNKGWNEIHQEYNINPIESNKLQISSGWGQIIKTELKSANLSWDSPVTRIPIN